MIKQDFYFDKIVESMKFIGKRTCAHEVCMSLTSDSVIDETSTKIAG